MRFSEVSIEGPKIRMYVYVGLNEPFSLSLHGQVEMREPFFYFSSGPCSLCCAAQLSRVCFFSYFCQPTRKVLCLVSFSRPTQVSFACRRGSHGGFSFSQKKFSFFFFSLPFSSFYCFTFHLLFISL